MARDIRSSQLPCMGRPGRLPLPLVHGDCSRGRSVQPWERTGVSLVLAVTFVLGRQGLAVAVPVVAGFHGQLWWLW